MVALIPFVVAALMIICYQYGNGEERTFITKEITRMITFERLVGTKWGNTPWDQ